MMKLSFATISLFIIVFSSCKSLNVRAIKSMKKVNFQEMQLSPGFEPNELRIDVVRQITETYVDETTIIYDAVPYHPLGFDLGNGLFYDMNGNLSFRLDQLLEFNPEKPFELSRNVRPENENNLMLHTFNNESLSIARLPRGKSRIAYHKKYHENSTAFLKKDRFRYSIFKTDSSLSYTFRNNKPLQIIKADEDNYYTFRRKRLREFSNSDQHLILGKVFSIRLSEDKKTITINSPSRDRNHKKPRITIQKNKQSIYVYSKRYKGTKLELTDYGILLTGTNVIPTLYQLKVNKDNFIGQVH